MNTQSNQARAIFLEAIEQLSPEQRADFVAGACGDDRELRERVERLLRSHELLGSFHDAAPPTAAAIDQPPLERPGMQIGPYKLLQQIGEGGMGAVYMAEQKEPVERRVALKIIKPGMDTRQVIARFEAERQALAMMDHPNIAKVLDAGTTDSGRPYFLMELVNGIPVTQFCDEQHLTARERLELFIPICQAVQHAHQKGIIHRDIKPSNILIALYDGRPVPKVIDFGVAKATGERLTERTTSTGLGQIVGTIEYMSPEQAQVNQLDIDTRSDIYSLGVVLYELLTGATPFDKQRLRSAAWDEMLRIVREEEPPRPSTRLSDSKDSLPSISAQRHTEPAKLARLVRGELDWIVMKALDKDRARRYETASSLAADIAHYLNDEPVAACPPSAGYRFHKFARRNKVAFATSGIVATSLVLGLLATSWQAIRATRAEGVALAERDEKEAARRQALASAEQARAAAEAEAKQRKLAEAAARAERQAKQAEAHQRQQAEASEKKASEEAAVAKAVSQFLQQDLLGLAGAEAQLASRIEPDPNLKLATLLDRALAKVDERFADQPRVRADVQDTLAYAFHSIGRYAEAIRLWEQVRQYLVTMWGPEHPWTLRSISNLAVAYSDAGQCDRALELHEQTLELHRKVLGPEHPHTLWSMDNLAWAYLYAGQIDKAVTLHERTCELKRKILGPEHPETLWSMSSLASAYLRAGQTDKAVTLHEQTIELQRKIQGPEHPDTLNSMDNLASAYRAAGQYSEALELQGQTVKLKRKVLGPEHPDTLASLHNLANSYCTLGRHADALKLRQETLAILKAKLGPEHPDTLSGMHNLALSYATLGRHADALKLDEETLVLRRANLPPDHPDTLRSMHNVACDYRALGRHTDALKLLEQTLALQKANLGPDHPDTLLSMSAIAVCYHKLGQHTDALKLHEETLALQMAKLGPDHPDTLRSRGNLALSYAALGRHADAIKLDEETLVLRTARLGPLHPDTLVCMNNLALSCAALGRHADALKLYEQTLAARTANLGPDHPDTLNSICGVAASLLDLDRGAEAVPIIDECLQRAAGKSVDPRLISKMTLLRLRHFEKAKDAAGCRATAGLWEELELRDAGNLYDAACMRAVTAAVIRAGDESETAIQDAAAEADRAMAWLKQAVAAGYNDTEHMKQDSDLDALRDREDFRKLLADLEANPAQTKK